MIDTTSLVLPSDCERQEGTGRVTLQRLQEFPKVLQLGRGRARSEGDCLTPLTGEELHVQAVLYGNTCLRPAERHLDICYQRNEWKVHSEVAMCLSQEYRKMSRNIRHSDVPKSTCFKVRIVFNIHVTQASSLEPSSSPSSSWGLCVPLTSPGSH